MSKILVTGGAGFIGSNLVDALIEANHEVIIIDDLSSGKEDYLNPKAKFYKMDVCSDEIAEIFRKELPEYVFHLAAQINAPASLSEPVLDGKINVLGSLNVFQNCIDCRVNKIIFMSSGGAIYGDTNEPADENFKLNADNLYGVHKFTIEKDLELLGKHFRVDHVILRPANVYGPRQYKGGEGAVVAVFTANGLNGEESTLFGDGSQTRDFVYVGDLVKACLLSLEDGTKGVYNIGTGQKTNLLDLIQAIEKVLGKNIKIKQAEKRKGDVQNSVLDSRKIKSDKNWSAETSLEEGVAKTIDWLKNYSN